MNWCVRAIGILSLFSALVPVLLAQHRVDSHNLYERIIVVVRLTGAGTVDDPVRPMYAPRPDQLNASSHTGIIAYHFVTTDDGNFAIVEFVARDRSAFAPILADPSVTAFLRNNSASANVLSTLQKVKKNFNLDQFAGTAVAR